MKAMILAAGLGTRLKPWTESHPKALVPVGGVPMLERVIVRLKEQGFTDMVVNIHHFGEQIIDFLASHEFGVNLEISDERGLLLDTGGALVKARSLLNGSEPVLIHNVDILSNADLGSVMTEHSAAGAGATLLVSDRDSSRKLVFDADLELSGWRNLNTGDIKVRRAIGGASGKEYAFSGIHVVSPSIIDEMAALYGDKPFPVMDFYLNPDIKTSIKGFMEDGLELIDIGKPGTLARANSLFI